VQTFSPIIELWVLAEDRQSERMGGGGETYRQIDRQDEVHRCTFATFLMDAPQVRHFHSEFPIYYYKFQYFNPVPSKKNTIISKRCIKYVDKTENSNT